MNKNLKSALKEHYTSKELSPSQLSLLKDLNHSPKINAKWMLPAFCGFFAALLIAFVSFKNQQIPVTQKIAKEVSYNHKKAKPPEVITNNYKKLNAHLGRLDFTSVPSRQLSSDFKLIGGRYCSIQGKIAAQLKLKNTAENSNYTLYQFKANNLIPLNTKIISIPYNKVLVSIWREGDLGFALAKDHQE